MNPPPPTPSTRLKRKAKTRISEVNGAVDWVKGQGAAAMSGALGASEHLEGCGAGGGSNGTAVPSSRQQQNFGPQLANELVGQPRVQRAWHGAFQGDMAVGESHVGLLAVAKMAVGIITRAAIIRLQIQVIPFLKHRMRGRGGRLKVIDLRGVGKQRRVRRTQNPAGVHRLAGRSAEDK